MQIERHLANPSVSSYRDGLRRTWVCAQEHGIPTKAGLTLLLLSGMALGIINMLAWVHLIVAIFSA